MKKIGVFVATGTILILLLIVFLFYGVKGIYSGNVVREPYENTPLISKHLTREEACIGKSFGESSEFYYEEKGENKPCICDKNGLCMQCIEIGATFMYMDENGKLSYKDKYKCFGIFDDYYGVLVNHLVENSCSKLLIGKTFDNPTPEQIKEIKHMPSCGVKENVKIKEKNKFGVEVTKYINKPKPCDSVLGCLNNKILCGKPGASKDCKKCEIGDCGACSKCDDGSCVYRENQGDKRCKNGNGGMCDNGKCSECSLIGDKGYKIIRDGNKYKYEECYCVLDENNAPECVSYDEYLSKITCFSSECFSTKWNTDTEIQEKQQPFISIIQTIREWYNNFISRFRNRGSIVQTSPIEDKDIFGID